jgi:glycosyltransferase involved in cell wall biosynthesis
MINGKRIIVVMPAYNAETTLEMTVNEIPRDIIDDIIVVDDFSHDRTVALAKKMGLKVEVHKKNLGYGANQKTCYKLALKNNADVVVMLHPDYQYSPKLLCAMAAMICYGEYDAVIGSRIVGGGALQGGMPLYKYFANRFLTAFQNIMLGSKLSEYHTGYRAFKREILEHLPLEINSDNFIFDNQMLAQIMFANYRIGELSCPTKYFKEASSINFMRSVEYGIGVVFVSIAYRLQKIKLCTFEIFKIVNKP